CSGNSGASASTKGSSHSVNAAPAPNMRRAGRRSNNTSANPSVAPHNIRNRTSVMTAPLLVKLIDQFAQFGHVLRAQFLIAAEMHQQRRDLSAENAIEQAAAFVRLPLLARQDGRIEVAPSFALRTHCALADQ